MKFWSYILLAVIALSFSSCEEQMIPIPPIDLPDGERVLLIEEFTGVKCLPCYGAGEILKTAVEQFGDALVIYGVHGSIQSAPHKSEKYTSLYDFRNQDGIELESQLNVTSNPTAVFDRNINSAGANSWLNIIEEELSKPQVADILVNPVYDPVTRRVDINIGVTPLEDISGDVDIHVAVSESHLIDPQAAPTNSDGIENGYDHLHVFKTFISSINGDALASNMTAGNSESKKYSYTLPDQTAVGEWIAENMEITVFITAKDRDNTVQQAAQVHITE